jgi:ABC-type transporter Mla subunit MlaD
VLALDKLSERISTINQESLDRMAHQHAKALAEATKEEMHEFKLALTALAGHLSTAGSAINQGAGEAASLIEGAGMTLMARIGESGAAFTGQMSVAAQAIQDATIGTANQLDAAGKRLAQGAASAGAEMTAAVQGASDVLRGSIETAATRLQQAGQNAAASIDIASTSMKLQSENMADTMTAQVDKCAQALGQSAAHVDRAMTDVMQRLGVAAQQASQQWAGGVTSAVDLLTDGAKRASDVLGDSTAQAAQAFNASAAELSRSAQNFSSVMSEKLAEVATATETMSREVQAIARSARQLADQGVAGAEQFSQAMARTTPLVAAMGEMSKDWDGLVSGLRGAAKDVRDATAPFNALIGSMTKLNAELAARAPEALGAIRQVTQLLETSAQQTREAMMSSRAAMLDTSTTLHKTVASMQTGVESYTGQVAALHQQLDAALSKAIRDINGSISNMSQAVEELNDTFGRLPLKG